MKLRLSPSSGNTNAEPVTVEAAARVQLSRAIWLNADVSPQPLCGGLGRCGRCRARFVQNAPPPLPAEEAILSQEDVQQGWRLACRRQTPDSASTLELELPPENLTRHAPDSGATHCCPDTTEYLAVAVDMGTTSVCWQALVAEGGHRGEKVAEGKFLNPQAGAGADVMSRLAMAAEPSGRQLLSAIARNALKNVLGTLPGKVSRLCLAANTAMTDIFLDYDVSGLCAAPYHTSHAGDETLCLPAFPPVYIPPLPAPFVGGDVSAGIAALLACATPRPFVLADMGTNGEFALVTERDALYLTSVPLGPALEGIGLECGRMAGPQTITEFCLSPSGLATRMPEGSAAASALGISATGYLSLLVVLLSLNVLDASGHFADAASPGMPLARKVAANITRRSNITRLGLPDNLWLSAPDVEELLKVKASFALALDKLSAAAAVPPRDMTLHLAGAMGEHVNPDWLKTLGFVPPEMRVRNAGNTALAGAALLALDSKQAEATARLCRRARVLSLADDTDFQRDYCKQMRFGV